MSDPIPEAEQAYDQFMNLFVPYVATNAGTVGVLPATASALTAALTDWTDGLTDDRAKAAAAQSATALKNERRAALTALARPVIQAIQANPAVTNDMRQLMGLPIPDTTRTRVPVPTTRPVIKIETREHLQHIIHFRDEATPASKAKPNGVRGAQVRVFIGANPPADLEQFPWVALDSATPYLMLHNAADAGKTAYYALRWENTRGETGPWSDAASATIPA